MKLVPSSSTEPNRAALCQADAPATSARGTTRQARTRTRALAWRRRVATARGPRRGTEGAGAGRTPMLAAHDSPASAADDALGPRNQRWAAHHRSALEHA